MWESKVVAAVDAADMGDATDAADVVESNLKHKVTPDRGDLISKWAQI